MSAIETAADRLWEAARTAVPCDPVRDLIGADDLDAAYRVQALLTERRLADGQRLVGRKIGLTSAAVQVQLGVDQPDFGPLFAHQVHADGAALDRATFVAPRVEAEVALVLAEDLTHPEHTVLDVVAATAYALPAIEVVDSRVRDWDIRITDTVADAASCGACVVGTRPVALDDVDLRRIPASLRVGGEERSSGTGAASLGHPLRAAVWLADELVRRGDPLRAGDLVLTGALGPMVPVAVGDEVEADLGALGPVSCSFVGAEVATG